MLRAACKPVTSESERTFNQSAGNGRNEPTLPAFCRAAKARFRERDKSDSEITAHTGPSRISRLLQRSFPKADIEGVALHLDMSEFGIAAVRARSSNIRLSFKLKISYH